MGTGSDPNCPSCHIRDEPSIRGEPPSVEDLKEKFREILEEEFMFGGPHSDTGLDFTTEINRAVERLYDAVTQTSMLDPH
jgi:hypothetical protein